VDGNFSADHLKQKNPLDDVPLTNGEGMMTNQARYKAYLAHPVAVRQVSGISGCRQGFWPAVAFIARLAANYIV